jgi:hypothetical protein
MGIRFACHVCDHPLNIKRELAGRRGICPSCSSRFRIPHQDTERSTPIDGLPSGGESDSTVVDATPPVTDKTPTRSILDLDDGGTWYVRPPSGGQYGPATTVLLKQWIEEGRIAASSLLWRDGWPQWREAGEALPELIAPLPQPAQLQSSSATQPANKPAANKPAANKPEFAIESAAAPAPPVAETSAGTVETVPPLVPATGGSPDQPIPLSGRSTVGLVRRNRFNRRLTWIILLTVLSVILIAGLIYALSQ